MALLDDISTAALQRLEELNPASPVFWNLQNEIRPLVLEALCEATLICGEPEVRPATAFTIPASTTFLNMPDGAFGILRVELGGLPLRKVSLFDLDMQDKAWQLDDPTDVPLEWFPLGLSKWGVHPQVVADVQCLVTVVQFPVTTPPPYTGAEPVPFQTEFDLGLESYVNCWARLKEGGADLDAGLASYEVFLSVMEEMSNFALRKGSLRFSKTMGSISEVSPIQKK